MKDKIQPVNFAEKPFRRLKIKGKLKLFNETKKKKILKFKELCFLDSLPDKFPQITLKFVAFYLFSSFLSCFFYIKFPF